MFPGQGEKQVSPKRGSVSLARFFSRCLARGPAPPPRPRSSATRGDGSRACISLLPTATRGENHVPHEAEPRLGLREDGIPLCPALAALPQRISSGFRLPSPTRGAWEQRTRLGVALSAGASPRSLLKGLGNLSLQNAITDCFQSLWLFSSLRERVICQRWSDTVPVIWGLLSSRFTKGLAWRGAARCCCGTGQP